MSSVVSYLTEIYQSIAETLPDFRDDTWDVQTSLELGDGLDKDDYADLMLEQRGDEPGPGGKDSAAGSSQKKCKGKGSKTRKMKRSVMVNLDRKAESGGLYEDRWLPPGQIKDHWELYKKRQRGFQCASFTTFWRVTWISSQRVCFLITVTQTF